MIDPQQPAFAGRTIVCALLDRSGSMQQLVSETIGGYNGFIANLRAEQLERHLVTLTVFDTDVDVLYAMVPLEDVAELTNREYKIGGMTALYDALAETINAVDQQVTADDRVLILVTTDGLENSWHEITSAAKMKEIIDRYTARSNWTFTYLSASPSAFADAAAIGVSHGNTKQYEATSQGTQQAYAAVSASAGNFSRSAGGQSTLFYTPDPDDVPVAPRPGPGAAWGTPQPATPAHSTPSPIASPSGVTKVPRRKSVAKQIEESAAKK